MYYDDHEDPLFRRPIDHRFPLPTVEMPRGMGWKRDLMDPRDYRYSASRGTLVALPSEADLRPLMKSHLNQANIGSCTAHNYSYAYDLARVVAGLSPMNPSRLFHYYNTRVLEGTVGSDSGASIRNTIQAGVKWGSCPESLWTYENITSKFLQAPPQNTYMQAEFGQIIEYSRVEQNREQIMAAIVEGHVVMFGFLVFDQFTHLPSSGIVEMPPPGGRVLGGHAGSLCGYRQSSRGLQFINRNSYGPNDGDHGDDYFPEAYIMDRELSADFWIIKVVETGEPPAPTPPPPSPVPTPEPITVGPGIRRVMDFEHDQPAHREDYAVNEFGDMVGWSKIWGTSLKEYEYIPALKKIVVTYLDGSRRVYDDGAAVQFLQENGYPVEV